MPNALRVSRVQKKGQVTIPSEIRQKLGLEVGDLVAFIETKDGVVLSPQTIVSTETLDKVGTTRRTGAKRQDQPALTALFDFLERLKSGEMEKDTDLTPEEGRRIVEMTAGIFRRGNAQEPQDFGRLRRRFEEETAEQIMQEKRANED